MAATSKTRPARTANRGAVKLLAGGNPQIAKGTGDQPVQAYIDAIRDWKRPIARRIDELVTQAIPNVRKAVKYNSPLYGGAGREDWFLSMHCFNSYLKVTFFNGTAFDPMPPGESKQKTVRYLDIRADAALDERQVSAWIRQAGRLPGQKL
nr:hypothetical protein [uncultured bacterium]